ncbi:MAG: c-type cytochrome, partial [Aquificae bacterium]|nr:c-type cytochrome [Aquificota bacterium]
KGCGSCHQPTADTVGPSLKKIAQAYNSVDELVKYLKGELQPKVWPDKASIMNPQLMQLKGLSEQELKDLAAYILSYK